jgi:hypothetical protein
MLHIFKYILTCTHIYRQRYNFQQEGYRRRECQISGMYTYIYICIYMDGCMYGCMYVCIYVCMDVCMDEYIYVMMSLCLCI